MATSSRLFEPYKSIGLVSSSVPHLVRYIDHLNKIQIVTAVGRSFLVFNDKLQLIETCVAHSSDITLLASNSRLLFTAATNEIFAWKYGHRWKVKNYQNDEKSMLTGLLVLGGQLLAINQNSTLFCWEIASQNLITKMSMGQNFSLTSMLHPATYINKVLLGSQQGTLQLWNLAKQKLVYQYAGFGSPVCCMVQAPALHIVAIGHQSGLIVMHHLQQDVCLMRFRQELGPVTSIAFRTDDAATLPIMVSSSDRSGHLVIWNLEEKRMEQQMRNLHWDSIVAVSFINKQPLMVTNSGDNSLKVFVFDHLQTAGRLLFQREGHRAPVTRIKFYDDKFVISAGLDSTLRSFSIYSERLNRSLGLASLNRKLAKKKGVKHDTKVLAPIVHFALETVREKQWDNIVACHRNTALVTTWNVDRMRMGQHRLLHERFKSISANDVPVQAQCVTITSCGNFALIGYSTGHLDRFNIQSGIHRCTYEDWHTAHQGAVRAVTCDAFNQMVVSGGADKMCKVWRFAPTPQQNQLLIGSLKLKDAVNGMCLHKENQFVAISLDDFSVIVMDLESKKIVRSFEQHRNRITDMTFDHDCRRLLVSSMDSLIYIWDMASGQLVDLMATATPCVSLSLCSSGELLATAHVNDIGIYIWSNLSVYSKVTLQPLSLKDIQEAPLLRLPTIECDELGSECIGDVLEDSSKTTLPPDLEVDQLSVMDIDYEYKSPEQISAQLITLSNVVGCQWKNLLNIELIKRRNKPKEVLEKPLNAPFFLPSVSGLKPRFLLLPNQESAENLDENVAKKCPKIVMSDFVESLHRHFMNDELLKFFDHIKSYGPSKIDAEIRSLGVECTGKVEPMLEFLCLIQCVLEENRDFQLVNSYLALFLKIHLDTVRKEHLGLVQRSRMVAQSIEQKWQRLQQLMDRSICLVNFLRNALI